jgi:tetratricopeptide (TPR) repeat protein
LEKDRSRRYETATSLAMDVQRYLADEPVLACPPSASYRLRKFVWRHKGPALAAGLVALTLMGGIVGTTLGLIEAHCQRDAAQAAVEAEKEAKETAQAREAETQAVLEFVESRVFAAARPGGQEGGLGRDVSLRQAIAAALPVLEMSFPAKPLIEARLRLTVGWSLWYLGEVKSAAEQFQTARTLYTQHRPPAHPDTLRTMYGLAVMYSDQGRYDDAFRLHEQTLSLRKATLGPDHPDTLWSMTGLAASYYFLGRYADALRLHEETLALRKAVLGPDHPDTVWSMTGVAWGYAALGRHPEALKVRDEVLRLRKAALGPDHPDTLLSMYELANSYAALGRHADALKLHEGSLALRKVVLGPDHPDTVRSMQDVADSLIKLGRSAEAVLIIDQCVTLAVGKPAPPRLILDVMHQRLRHFAQAGDAAGCRATAVMWDKLNRADAEGLYTAARFRAVTAAALRANGKREDAAAEADRAMASLKQAIAAGYRGAAQIAKDPDLGALRDREDFKRLVAELEAKRE